MNTERQQAKVRKIPRHKPKLTFWYNVRYWFYWFIIVSAIGWLLFTILKTIFTFKH